MVDSFISKGDAQHQWRGDLPGNGLRVAVVDGMGGYEGGADAAALTALALRQGPLPLDASAWDRRYETLSHNLLEAGQVIGAPEMGAVVALLGVTADGIIVTNVGDCRTYQIRDGRLEQLSQDDRAGAELIRILGDVDDDEIHAMLSSLGGVTQALGAGGSERTIDAHFFRQSLTEGNHRYILCSDGVWGEIPSKLLQELGSASAPPAAVVDSIIDVLAAALVDRVGAV